MTLYDLSTHKGECKPIPVLYRKALYFIKVHAKRRGELKDNIIPYSSVYHTLASMMHLGKDEAVEVFEEMKGAGYLEICPYKGIRIVPIAEVNG